MIRLIYYLFIFLLSIISIFLGFNSMVIPNKYLYLIILFDVLLLVIIFILITRKRKIFRFLAIFLSLFLLAGDVLMGYIFYRTNSFFGKINNIEYETSNYSVLVLKETDIDEMDDINELGSWNNQLDSNYDDALAKFVARTDIEIKNFENVFLLVNDFLAGEVQAILLNENYIEIIDENNEGFKDNIKIISTESIKSLTEKLDNTVDIRDLHSFNVYVSGIDTYGDISTVSRSDVNIIATINLDQGKILLTNTPRDYYVQLAGTTGNKDKLTHAGYYGINTSIKTLEGLFDTKIDYYVRVNFNSLISIVDEIGGIDVYSDYAVTTHHYKVRVVKGWNHFNGEQALGYSRERYAYQGGDRQRGKNQQQVIEAIIKKVTESNDANTYLKLLNVLENSFQTNMDKKLINSLINLQIKKKYNWVFESISVDGYGSSDYTYSYPGQVLWVMKPNYDTVNAAKKKIKETLEYASIEDDK